MVCVPSTFLVSSDHIHVFVILIYRILSVGKDKRDQTVQTLVRLLLKEQSNQRLRCSAFHLYLLNALLSCRTKTKLSILGQPL